MSEDLQLTNPLTPQIALKWLAGGLMAAGATGLGMCVALIGFLFILLLGVGLLIMPFAGLPWVLILHSWRGSAYASFALLLLGGAVTAGYCFYFGNDLKNDGTIWSGIPWFSGTMALGAALMFVLQLTYGRKMQTPVSLDNATG